MKHTHRKWLAGLLALLLAAGLLPAPEALADVFSSPQAVEWQSGSVKVRNLGLGPVGARKTDPLGRSGVLLQPGSSCFENWDYSWNDLYWKHDSTQLEASAAWTTQASGRQERLTFL